MVLPSYVGVEKKAGTDSKVMIYKDGGGPRIRSNRSLAPLTFSILKCSPQTPPLYVTRLGPSDLPLVLLLAPGLV